MFIADYFIYLYSYFRNYVIIYMKKAKLPLNIYLAPEIDFLTIAVEEGFSISEGQLPEYKEDDDVIIIG